MTCRHLEQADEAYRIGGDGRQIPAIVMLCGFADAHPERLTNAPRWLQRNAISGHLLDYPRDCIGCPAFEGRSA